jgi:drug/metabolite transporter (DMT)-like permease
MAGTRFLIAGALVYFWRRLSGDPAPTPRQWLSAAVIGVLLLLGGNGLVTWAEQSVASGITALIVASAPLWMVLIDAVRVGGTRPNLQTSLGVLVGLLGIGVLVGPSQWAGSSLNLDLGGVVALLLAEFLWAVGSLYSRTANLPTSPFLGTGMEMLVGSAALFAVGTLSGEWGRLDVSAITLRSVSALGYLIVVGSLVGFAAYTWLLRVAPTPLVSTHAYVNPLIAVLLGSVLAKEPLFPHMLLAAAVILSAVVLINTSKAGEVKPASQRLEVSQSTSED